MSSLNKKRILIILLIFLVLIFLILIRLVWLQVIMSSKYSLAVKRQTTSNIILKPQRGIIYDANGNILATNVPGGDVFASPKNIKHPDKVTDELYKLLNMKRDNLYKILNNKTSEWAMLKKNVPLDNINKIKKLNLTGIYIDDTNIRSYPDNNLLSQTLGFTGSDGNGLYGLEYSFEKYLKGIPGLEIANTDEVGHIIGLPEKLYKPERGNDVVLTIDSVIQGYAETAIEKAYENYSPANGITAIVINPKTGDILAMASKPDFNPNEPYKVSSDNIWSNPAVSGLYEPGSVFKVVTASAALEQAVVTPNEQFYDPGYYIVAGHRINSWTNLGSIDFAKAVEMSSDTVFMKIIVERLGLNTLYKYIHSFGFGEETGIPLPGEASGMIIQESKVQPVDLASISFGQGIAVTPLQMLNAFSATINGGYLMKPNIVKEVKNNDKVIKEFKPQVVRQVISEDTSNTMKTLLQKVVDEGTGKACQIPGVTVGGKSGTTENYSPGKYTASFAAFAPVDNPEVAVIVVIRNPTKNGHMGGEIAAPVVKDILSNTLRYISVKK
ncbi:penicillin-binding transpeptidase domain-containing protein [Thermoanaerobacterium sp. RBIITD]|uniref:peptidoglycan D,D-transpeptidase FtsI family protein n=1 Tax=Thermoanaerobacterium sp. RBIITD TaxID=1550240 RepID=UPI000BB7ACDF|nr:penicillin-binding transpeptidase domain-containing protein [Thermoanaerobacterium sp. RBIITD]SNX54707.1 stage V sporulation protein D (sporulation-specific penicillin-binding protein) [Thermoanaerobacterium sp. RBIITD]